MTTITNIHKAKRELVKGGALFHFISVSQRQVLRIALCGEEANHFADVILQAKEVIEKMPKVYEQDGAGQNAVVHLRYFRGGIDAWITEKDIPDGEDDRQHQAYGKITLTGNKEDAELGYISIEELINNGVELDLYWKPVTLKDI